MTTLKNKSEEYFMQSKEVTTFHNIMRFKKENASSGLIDIDHLYIDLQMKTKMNVSFKIQQNRFLKIICGIPASSLNLRVISKFGVL